MSVNWTLKDASGAALTHQPASGSPLALQFNTQGYAYYSTYSTEIIDTVEVEVDSTGPVTLSLSPDTSGYTLDETLSDPTELPSSHGGVLSWTSSGSTTNLSFTAPSSVDQEWSWGFGGLTVGVALKIKVRVRRT